MRRIKNERSYRNQKIYKQGERVDLIGLRRVRKLTLVRVLSTTGARTDENHTRLGSETRHSGQDFAMRPEEWAPQQ